MSVEISQFLEDLDPERTVLLFGSGSSVPSGGPKVGDLVAHYARALKLPEEEFSLSEITSLAERKMSRSRLIKELRSLCGGLKPAGGLKNLPLYSWKGIYTTNYDDLIEQVYTAAGKELRVYHSDFCFTAGNDNPDCTLFKLHGTIATDVSDGHTSRIILTEGDYQLTEQYRGFLFDRLKGDLAGANLIVIGHSLADRHIKDIVDRAARLNAEVMSPAKISLLLYTSDENRASLFEARGITVCFGGIDDFFKQIPSRLLHRIAPPTRVDDPLDLKPALRPVTIEVADVSGTAADVSGMFNGKPASYADIGAGFTFQRKIAQKMVDYFDKDASLCATLLGASGVGKTTAARQAVLAMMRKGVHGWEHAGDHTLKVDEWLRVANWLKNKGDVGVLLVDGAHHHLHQFNELVDGLVQDDNAHLKLIAVSTRNHWLPRVKSANIFKYGSPFGLSRLSPEEIGRLLVLLDSSPQIKALVEEGFSGFNQVERRRRLEVRCEKDMFVCMKNIFANDNFDNIVLQEFADLDPTLGDIYRNVAALETAGVRVHRQLVIRLLGLSAARIEAILDNLDEIVTEYTIDEKIGIYGWRCRHQVVSGIVTKYKFNDLDTTIKLFDDVIDNISPTYDVEIRSLRELCNVETGIARIPDKNVQNRLLRKMMSNAPGERVPRHRLIRNLIDQGYFEKAETEIRLFNRDFGSDGPVHRYKILLLIERAVKTHRILEEDRVAILEQAHELAVAGATRYSLNKSVLSAYAELGIVYYKRTGSHQYYDEAVAHLENDEEKLADPQITQIIRRYSRRMAGSYSGPEDGNGLIDDAD